MATLSRSSNKLVPGGGNRWPPPPEASGGGGGGGGRGDGDGVDGFRQQLQRYRLGLLFTAASIVMLFISFTTLFVARRGAGRFDAMSGFQSDWIPVPLPIKILLVNSAVLGVGSLLVEKARRAARLEAVLVPVGGIPGVRGVRETSLLWVWATVLAGCGFLYGQFRAWQQLLLKGVDMTTGPASVFFYLLTGAHALHLLAGVVILLYACLAPGPRHSLERRSISLDVTAWYWHFMTVMWIYVLAVLKLMNS